MRHIAQYVEDVELHPVQRGLPGTRTAAWDWVAVVLRLRNVSRASAGRGDDDGSTVSCSNAGRGCRLEMETVWLVSGWWCRRGR